MDSPTCRARSLACFFDHSNNYTLWLLELSRYCVRECILKIKNNFKKLQNYNLHLCKCLLDCITCLKGLVLH